MAEKAKDKKQALLDIILPSVLQKKKKRRRRKHKVGAELERSICAAKRSQEERSDESRRQLAEKAQYRHS